MRLGFQLSSLKPLLKTTEGVRDALKRLHAMGYRTLQIQWIDPSVPDEAVADALRETGLTCLATQDYYEAIQANFDRYLRQCALWGGRYFTVSHIPERCMSIEGIKAYAGELDAMAERVRDIGATLSFHPTRTDYAPIDGIPALQRLMDAASDDMQLTLCLYHTLRAGQSPEAWLRRYAGRVDLVHLKNGIPQPDGTHMMMPVGQGDADWPPLLDACRKYGVKHALVEQEAWQKDPFTCMEESFEYLHGLGLEA